jgi:hypothetical protein
LHQIVALTFWLIVLSDPADDLICRENALKAEKPRFSVFGCVAAIGLLPANG